MKSWKILAHLETICETYESWPISANILAPERLDRARVVALPTKTENDKNKRNIKSDKYLRAVHISVHTRASRVRVTVACLLAETDTTEVRKGYLKGAYVPRCQAQVRDRHCSGP